MALGKGINLTLYQHTQDMFEVGHKCLQKIPFRVFLLQRQLAVSLYFLEWYMDFFLYVSIEEFNKPRDRQKMTLNPHPVHEK